LVRASARRRWGCLRRRLASRCSDLNQGADDGRDESTDPPLLVADAERRQDFYRARGVRLAVRPSHGPSDVASRSSRAFSRSRPTTVGRRSSISTGPTARRSRFSSPARTCNISCARAAGSAGCASRADRRLRMVVLANGRTRADGGQAHHFRLYAPEKISSGIDRYTNEVNRLFGVMNKRLASHEARVGRV
jgi:hypothetical protein